MSLCAQVTWHRMERLIARLNRNRRLSLKAGGGGGGGVRGGFLLVNKSF